MRRSPGANRRAARRPWPVLALSLAASAAVGAATVPSAAAATVTVRRSQTLTQIARQLHTTVAALVTANHLADPNRVLAGQVLQVPLSTTTAGADGDSDATPTTTTLAAPGSVTPTTTLPAPGTAPVTITVARGQTLFRIASNLHTTVAALVALNHLSDPNRLAAGQVLVIAPSPAAAGVVATPAGGGGTTALAAYQMTPQGTYPAPLTAHPARLALVPDYVAAASTYGVPQALLEALCWWESGWQANALSVTGAIGVCQIEPGTAAVVNSTLLHATLDPHVAAQNITMAAAYLASLLKATGNNVSQALAGYYQGLGSVARSGMLPSTVLYVRGIEAYATIFAG